MTHFDTFPIGIDKSISTILNKKPNIHPTCVIKDSFIGDYTELMMQTYIVESKFDDYSYALLS